LLCFSSVVLYLERRSRSSIQPTHSPASSYPVGPGGSVTGSHMGPSSHLANGSLVQSPRQQHRIASGKFCSAVGWKGNCYWVAPLSWKHWTSPALSCAPSL